MTTRHAALCLACSSSPSPKASSSPPFTTLCCARPICEWCLSKNPRLRGYNPCLACLVGVYLVGRSRTVNGHPGVRATMPGPSGQSKDQEQSIFVLGDSDDEDSGPKLDTDVQDVPPPYTGTSETATRTAPDETLAGDNADAEMAEGKVLNSSKYYIQPGDTLRGIALRYGVDGRKICQLNSMPFSTLSTTPHLLHTRRWLNLPPTGRPTLTPDLEVLQAHNRERAEKQFQFVTKEIDWRVAKAYVALAEEEDDGVKTKENLESTRQLASEPRALEVKAVDLYLDDGEWEARQSRGPHLQGFPLFAVDDEKDGKITSSSRFGKLIRH